jgi:hypothetical protein
MVFVEGDDYRQLRRPGDDPPQFRSLVRPGSDDAVIHEYKAQNFTPSNWPDSEQSADITPDGLTSSTLNGFVSVSADGVDDDGLDGTLGDFGSNTDTDFAIEFVLQTTDNGVCIGVDNKADSMSIDIRVRNNTFEFTLRSSADNGDFIGIGSPVPVTDGTARHIICNKTGNNAADVQIFSDGVDKTGSVFNDGFEPSDTVDFDTGVGYFARNDAGTVENRLDADIPLIRWYDDSLNQAEIQDAFNSQPYV